MRNITLVAVLSMLTSIAFGQTKDYAPQDAIVGTGKMPQTLMRRLKQWRQTLSIPKLWKLLR